jgi:hypothetical protein
LAVPSLCMCLLLNANTRPTTPTCGCLPIRRCPCTHVVAIVPRLKLNSHIRHSLHHTRFAPDLSIIPKCEYEEHKIQKAKDDLAPDANTRAEFRVRGARAPDEGHYHDDEGEHGLGAADNRKREDPDVLEYGCFCLLRFL